MYRYMHTVRMVSTGENAAVRPPRRPESTAGVALRTATEPLTFATWKARLAGATARHASMTDALSWTRQLAATIDTQMAKAA